MLGITSKHGSVEEIVDVKRSRLKSCIMLEI